MPIRRTLAVAASGADQVPLAAFLHTPVINSPVRGEAAGRSSSSQQ
jgi:hypothetical protein